MVVVRTPDRSATLSVTICKQTKETWESLWEIFSENSGLKPLSKIERVIANGLLGHGIFYTGALRSGLYYAARFVLPGGRAVAFAAQYPDGDPVPENSGFVSLVLHSLCAY